MGKQFGGVFANWNGKVGNVVGRVRQGRTVLAIYQPNVYNPNTNAQQSARSKFSVLVQFLSKMLGILRVGFHDLDGYKTGNAFSAAVGYNYKNGAVTGAYPNMSIDNQKVVLSQGVVDLPYTPQVTADGTTLAVTWADNSGIGNANADDDVMLAVYNPDKDTALSTISLAKRSARNGSFALPVAWTGDTVWVYLAVSRPGTSECSMSTLAAVLNL